MRSNESQVDMMTIQLSTSISATHDRDVCIYTDIYKYSQQCLWEKEVSNLGIRTNEKLRF